MAAYVVAEVEVTDPVTYEDYRKLVPATVAKYGGRFLVRGGAVEVKEGGWQPKRLVVLEFPSMDQARQWYGSPEYAPALAGALGGRFAPQVFRAGGAHGAAAHHYGPAIIDDDTPTPEHARYRPRRLLAVTGAGIGLWAAALGLLVLAYGWQGTLAQMGWFFTKAALLTFGGAYAVLPYVYQAAVENHQWLTATQMIDGLALGETTPGPLIMVVAFVGFVGGWSQALFGAEHLFLAGAAAAVVATYFTFLPSFLFIFAGAPLVEATHGDLKFTAPLTGITAAVVGVVVSLAVFFAQHVFLAAAAIDWASVALAAAALVALMRFRVGLIPVILGCGAAGLCYRLLVN